MNLAVPVLAQPTPKFCQLLELLWCTGSQDRVQTGPGAVHVLRNLAPAANELQPYACFRQRPQETRHLSAAIVDVDVHRLLTGVSLSCSSLLTPIRFHALQEECFKS